MFVISVNIFVIRDFRGACSYVKMQKGCMATERLGTPDLACYPIATMACPTMQQMAEYVAQTMTCL